MEDTSSKIRINHYYDYEELVEALCRMEADKPELCRVSSIGITHEGRKILLMEITDHHTGSSEKKAGYYVEACTHAEEFCGTNAALQLAARLIYDFEQSNDINRLLKNVVFYIIPMLNPDGVERIMKTGVQGVGNGKYPLSERQPLPGLKPWDINGDHIVAQMRIMDSNGEWRVSEKDPRLMVLRKPYEQEGIFYRMYPEGEIQGDITGFEIPMPKDVNLNRNYPVNWLPEELQYGACEFPLSEPETRAVAYFIQKHPNIAGVISYHTNAGAIMRPFSGKSDDNFEGADLALYNALGAMGKEELGYEVMSTYGGFTPDKSRIRGGTLSDMTFEMMGIPSFMLELWNVYDAAGTQRPKEFHFAAKDEDKELTILKWADKEIGSKAYLNWEKFDHPQLGMVEIGGWNRIYVERNPPESYLYKQSDAAASFTIKLAQSLPKLVIKSFEAVCLEGSIYKISAVVGNAGYLPTYLTSQALSVHRDSPIKMKLEALKGSFQVECCTDGEEIGHLEGRFGRDAEWSHDRAMWRPTEHKIEWIIRLQEKRAILKLTVESERCGSTCSEVEIAGN